MQTLAVAFVNISKTAVFTILFIVRTAACFPSHKVYKVITSYLAQKGKSIVEICRPEDMNLYSFQQLAYSSMIKTYVGAGFTQCGVSLGVLC